MSQPLIILITGANQGIGYSAAELLAKTNKYHVLVGSRSLTKASDAISKITSNNQGLDSSHLEPLEIDLDNDDTITKAAETIKSKHGHLDILVNNAAISSAPGKRGATDRKNLDAVYATNVSGTSAVTEAMLPLLRASKASPPARRIVFVSSKLGSMSIASTKYFLPSALAYNCSKAALNMLALHYAYVLKNDGITSVVLCPGHNATNLNNYEGVNPPDYGGRTIVRAISEGGADMNGVWFNELEGFAPW